MNIKLPIPIRYNGKKLYNVTLKKPTAGVLSETNKAVESGNRYKALQVCIAGCIESIEDIKDRLEIRNAVGGLTYKAAEYVIAQISCARNNGDDGIEGFYKCPRCGEAKVCEQTPEGDNRDHYNALPLKETDEIFFTVDLDAPVAVHAVEGDPGGTVNSLSMTYPTLNDCSVAYGKAGDKESVRFQLSVYNEALTAINGEEIDVKYRNRYGMTLFDRLEIDDLKKISRAIDSAGVSTRVKKVCKCGREFEVILNPLDFFDSSLR